MAATPHDDRRPPLPTVRIADEDRQRTIARLSEAYAQDVIAVEEFERRVEAVYRASGVTEIAIKSTMGNVEILLPSGVTIENEGFALRHPPSFASPVAHS